MGAALAESTGRQWYDADIARRFGEKYAGIESIGAAFETLEVPSDQLIVLAQVRSGLNPVHQQLKDSIRKDGQEGGLQQEVSVAQMSSEELQAYMEFVNKLWGSQHKLDDHQPSADGFYYLVIAGHTRTVIAQELAAEAGTIYSVPCKNYGLKSPQDIIAHQLDENLHSRPAPEREAMAIVESYVYGVEQGLWQTKAEFMRSSQHNFSRYALDRALLFAELPTGIRQFVLDGGLPYMVGIELGRATRAASRYFNELYNAADDETASAVCDWLQERIAHINNGEELSRRSDKARKYIQACVSELEVKMTEHREAGNMRLFQLELVSEVDPRREQISTLVGQLARDPLRKRALLVSNHAGLLGVEGAELVLGETDTSVREYLGDLGIVSEPGNGYHAQDSLLA